MRICVVTSVPASAEPRAPRHAIAAKELLPDAEVVFIDMTPRGRSRRDPQELRAVPGLIRQTIEYPSRRSGIQTLAWRKLVVNSARTLMRLTGVVTEGTFGDRIVGLTKQLRRAKADIYIAHNIETLLPAARAARSCGAKLIFDCMEYYSDMGDSQTPLEANAARKIEGVWLSRCSLVTASSDVLAEVLADQYGIGRPLALYNTPKVLAELPSTRRSGLRLYWRNSVIGFGQRGLDDILLALTLLPDDVTLSLQGRPPMDGERKLRDRICTLRLDHRVTILPPYEPGEGVWQAAQHSVGLCLERRGPANHNYTIASKLFDYMMGGLAVVAADLPSLRGILERSQGGLLFEPGSPAHLAEQLGRLRSDPGLLGELSSNSRRFALTEGNVEVDMTRFKAALLSLVSLNAPRGVGNDA